MQHEMREHEMQDVGGESVVGFEDAALIEAEDNGAVEEVGHSAVLVVIEPTVGSLRFLITLRRYEPRYCKMTKRVVENYEVD